MKITVCGRVFSEEAKYYSWDSEKEFPHFDMVSEKVWEIEGEKLRDGVKWLIENHPDKYMGGSVSCENGDFVCLAVPCECYGKGNFETIPARIATAKLEAAEWMEAMR